MVKWFKYEAHLPAFILTFVNLRGLPKRESIRILSTGQKDSKAGLYARVQSDDAAIDVVIYFALQVSTQMANRLPGGGT